MNTRTLRFGLVVGVAGGLLMAAFAMSALAITGHGFFTVVNLIAHTFWKGAPLDGQFLPAAFALGLTVHLIISIAIGTMLAVLVERGALDGGTVFLLGIALGVSAWVVQSFAWPALDANASATFTPWVLAIAHLLFGVGSAMTLTKLEHLVKQRTSTLAGATA